MNEWVNKLDHFSHPFFPEPFLDYFDDTQTVLWDLRYSLHISGSSFYLIFISNISQSWSSFLPFFIWPQDLFPVFFPNSQLHLLFLLSFPNSTLLSMSRAHFVNISSFYGGSDGKDSACSAGDPGSIPGLGRSPGGAHGNALQYSCLENPCGQRSLASCNSRGCKESDTTEQPSPASLYTHSPDDFISPGTLTSSKFWWILTLWSRLDHIYRVADMKNSLEYLRKTLKFNLSKIELQLSLPKAGQATFFRILKNGNSNISQFLRQNFYSYTEHPKYVYVTSKMESNPSDIPHDDATGV